MPIPLIGRRKGIAHAGTGFLVVAGSRGWLVTCAHLATGPDDLGKDASNLMGGRLDVAGTGLGFNLWLNGRKRFEIARTEDRSGLHDVIAIDLPASEFSRVAGFGAHDFATIVDPEPNETLVAVGHQAPEKDPGRTTTVATKLLRAEGSLLLLDNPALERIPGSPATGARGLVGIVCRGPAPTADAGLALSLAAVAG